MTYHDMDPNLPGRDPDGRQSVDRRSGWGMPLAIAAIVIAAGLLFYNFESRRTTTASNDAPIMRQTNPSSPAPTPPAKPQ
jgi:hypothetical protein